MGADPPARLEYRSRENNLFARCALEHWNNVQVELIEVNAPLEQLYEGIRMQHENWDGTRPLRFVAELTGR